MADPIVGWFSTKSPTATPVLTFDFTNLLGAGVTIASSTVTTSVARGTDASHASILSTKTNTSPKVLQKVTGGLNGVTYLLKCAVVDSNTTTHTIYGYLAVDDPATLETATVPSETALVRIETLKATLNPPILGNQSDLVIDRLIRDVSSLFSDLLPDLSLSSATVTETRNGTGGSILMLRKRPATAVTSVSVDGATITAASTATAAGWVFDSDSGCVHLRGYLFTRGIQNVSVVYTAGITSTHRWAYLLERAAIITAAAWWSRMTRIDKVSESANGMVSTSYSQNKIPKEAQMILDHLTSKAVIFE